MTSIFDKMLKNLKDRSFILDTISKIKFIKVVDKEFDKKYSEYQNEASKRLKIDHNELFLSLEEDVINELIEENNISIETAIDVLRLNRFEQRFMSSSNQFDYLETEELAEEFYKTYKHLIESEVRK